MWDWKALRSFSDAATVTAALVHQHPNSEVKETLHQRHTVWPGSTRERTTHTMNLPRRGQSAAVHPPPPPPLTGTNLHQNLARPTPESGERQRVGVVVGGVCLSGHSDSLGRQPHFQVNSFQPTKKWNNFTPSILLSQDSRTVFPIKKLFKKDK